jgi:hypothetical protein
MTARIGVSPLTGRIFRGRLNAKGNAFVGDKQDITSDVLCAIVEKADYHGGTFEIEGGGKKWTVTVREAETDALRRRKD